MQGTKHSRQLAAKGSTQKPTQAASMRECDRSLQRKKTEETQQRNKKIKQNINRVYSFTQSKYAKIFQLDKSLVK